VLTGVVGHIKWHYYTAAAINGYTVSRSSRGEWSLTATVVLDNAYNLAQTPLTFVAMHLKTSRTGAKVKAEWRWPILSKSLNRDTHQLTARLGPPEM